MLEDKLYCVYIMTNKNNTVLYTGMTVDLKRRVYEHKQELVKGFTQKYKLKKLVYYEVFNNFVDAGTREKQIKAGSRAKKIALIEKENKEWKDLYYDI
jgi:putative endonuclease